MGMMEAACTTNHPLHPVPIRAFVWRIFMAIKICPCCGETFQPHHNVSNQTVQITSDTAGYSGRS